MEKGVWCELEALGAGSPGGWKPRGPCSVLNEGTGGLSGCMGFCGVGGGGEVVCRARRRVVLLGGGPALIL